MKKRSVTIAVLFALLCSLAFALPAFAGTQFISMSPYESKTVYVSGTAYSAYSNNTSIVTVTTSGTAVYLKAGSSPGTTTVTVPFTNNYNYNDSETITVTVSGTSGQNVILPSVNVNVGGTVNLNSQAIYNASFSTSYPAYGNVSFNNGYLTVTGTSPGTMTINGQVSQYNNSTPVYYSTVVNVGGGSNNNSTVGTINVGINQSVTSDRGQYIEIYAASADDKTICDVSIYNDFMSIYGKKYGTTRVKGSGKLLNGQFQTFDFAVVVGANSGNNNSNTTETVAVGETKTTNTNYSSCIVSSNNQNIVTASFDSWSKQIKIIGVNTGTATVSVNPSGYQSYNINVTVTGGYNNNTLSQSLSLAAGETRTATGSYYSISQVNSSNTNVATGTSFGSTLSIAGVNAGTCDITARVKTYSYSQDQTLSVRVTVTGNSNSGGSGSNGQTVELAAGKTGKTKAFISVASVTSSNTAIATAYATSDNRISITGVSPGTASISALIKENSYGTAYNYRFDVLVTGSSTGGGGTTSAGVYLGSKREYSVSKGKKYSIATVRLDGETLATNDRNTLLWVSSDTDIMTVDKYGKFTTKNRGTANLVALNKDGSKANYVTIIVN